MKQIKYFKYKEEVILVDDTNAIIRVFEDFVRDRKVETEVISIFEDQVAESPNEILENATTIGRICSIFDTVDWSNAYDDGYSIDLETLDRDWSSMILESQGESQITYYRKNSEKILEPLLEKKLGKAS